MQITICDKLKKNLIFTDCLSKFANGNFILFQDSPSEITGTPYSHRDEDMLLPKKQPEAVFKQSIKYDVEILESKEETKQNIEIEERYR